MFAFWPVTFPNWAWNSLVSELPTAQQALETLLRHEATQSSIQEIVKSGRNVPRELPREYTETMAEMLVQVFYLVRPATDAIYLFEKYNAQLALFEAAGYFDFIELPTMLKAIGKDRPRTRRFLVLAFNEEMDRGPFSMPIIRFFDVSDTALLLGATALACKAVSKASPMGIIPVQLL